MAREEYRDLGDLARGIRQAYLAVDAAIPLPFAGGGVVLHQRITEVEEHLMNLRETAFAALLDDLLSFGYDADPADLAALERGVLPPAREG